MRLLQHVMRLHCCYWVKLGEIPGETTIYRVNICYGGELVRILRKAVIYWANAA